MCELARILHRSPHRRPPATSARRDRQGIGGMPTGLRSRVARYSQVTRPAGRMVAMFGSRMLESKRNRRARRRRRLRARTGRANLSTRTIEFIRYHTFVRGGRDGALLGALHETRYVLCCGGGARLRIEARGAQSVGEHTRIHAAEAADRIAPEEQPLARIEVALIAAIATRGASPA